MRFIFRAAFVALALSVITAPVHAQEDGEKKAKAAEKKDQAKKKKSKKLGIGSKAPNLDIEHWVQDGKGVFAKTGEFEQGKVYVVEFWATWCGPCIASMPHIAQLQKDYADRGVQVISISDEDLETVEKFLEREVRGAEEGGPKTYGELTSVYCLTTDPDESCNRDYMRAAGQNGIPTAFIVGKTGLVEWIGHPMSMDEPLEQIVSDEWDLETAKEEFLAQQKAQEMMMKLSRLMRSGETKKAIDLLDEAIKETKAKSVAERFESIKFQIMASDKSMADETAKVALKILGRDGYDADSANNIAWQIYEMANAGAFEDEAVTRAALKLAESKVEGEGQTQAFLLDTVAHLHNMLGDKEAAIKAQKKAVEMVGADQKADLEAFLEELMEEKEDK